MQGVRFDPKPSQGEEKRQTSSPKGNDAHLRAIIQSETKWKHKFFRRLRAARLISVVDVHFSMIPLQLTIPQFI